ncbi:MAG: hypothetical protein IEMM0002_1130 [bacterium]|nr:MAG: hypothetical protein IEMM0002_1130 [bacterium]
MTNNAVLGILVVNILGFIFLWKSNKNLLYALFSISLLALFGFTVAKEFSPEWRVYQKEFLNIQIAKETDSDVIKSLKSAPIAIRQIWNNELGIADRCTTCHLAVDDPRFKDAPEPYRFHAAAREHDFGSIGCTICHWGQGRATDAEHAHATEIHYWDYPMWKGDLVLTSCPQCHEEIYEPKYKLKGAEVITMGRDLTLENELEIECVACHTIRGVGEVMAPDLTEFGSRTEHEFEQTHDLNYVEGKKTIYAWTFQHFLDPVKITPGDPETDTEPTIMPDFEFTNEQAHALTTFVLSLKPSMVPVKYQFKELMQQGSGK